VKRILISMFMPESRHIKMNDAADDIVARALSLLYQRAFEPANLKEIFTEFPVSRRHLDRCFHKQTGRTLLSELWRIRVERAQNLLQSTTWTFARIAKACGFSGRRQMARVFKNATGRKLTRR